MEGHCVSAVASFGCAVQNACCKELCASKSLRSAVAKLWFLVAITTTYTMLLTEQETVIFLLKAML